MAENKDHLKERRRREEEARHEDQDQSDSSKGDVMVEGEEESGPTCAEATSTPISATSVQEAEPSMEADVDDIPSLSSEDTATVMPEEDKMLTGATTSVSGEMARLQVSSPDRHKPKDSRTPQ